MRRCSARPAGSHDLHKGHRRQRHPLQRRPARTDRRRPHRPLRRLRLRLRRPLPHVHRPLLYAQSRPSSIPSSTTSTAAAEARPRRWLCLRMRWLAGHARGSSGCRCGSRPQRCRLLSGPQCQGLLAPRQLHRAVRCRVRDVKLKQRAASAAAAAAKDSAAAEWRRASASAASPGGASHCGQASEGLWVETRRAGEARRDAHEDGTGRWLHPFGSHTACMADATTIPHTSCRCTCIRDIGHAYGYSPTIFPSNAYLHAVQEAGRQLQQPRPRVHVGHQGGEEDTVLRTKPRAPLARCTSRSPPSACPIPPRPHRTLLLLGLRRQLPLPLLPLMSLPLMPLLPLALLLLQHEAALRGHQHRRLARLAAVRHAEVTVAAVHRGVHHAGRGAAGGLPCLRGPLQEGPGGGVEATTQLETQLCMHGRRRADGQGTRCTNTKC